MRSLSPRASSSRSSDAHQDLEEQEQYRRPDGSPSSSQQPQKLGDGRWKCSHCDKTFTRRGHLKRHEENHLPAKRYQCQFCLKSFARNDVLVRHRAVHQQGARPSDNSRSEAALKRARTACRQCSAIKMKCDGNLPCERCRAKPDGGIQCTYRSSTRLSSEDSPQQKQPDDPFQSDSQHHQHHQRLHEHQTHSGQGHAHEHLAFDPQCQQQPQLHINARPADAEEVYNYNNRSSTTYGEFDASAAASSLAGLSDPFYLRQHNQQHQQQQHPPHGQQQLQPPQEPRQREQQHTYQPHNHQQVEQRPVIQPGLVQPIPPSTAQAPPFDAPFEPSAGFLESPDFESYCGNGIFDWLFAAEQVALPWQSSEPSQLGVDAHPHTSGDGLPETLDAPVANGEANPAPPQRPVASGSKQSSPPVGTQHRWPNGHAMPSDRNGIVPVMLPEPTADTMAFENTFQVSALDDGAKERFLGLPRLAELPPDQTEAAETCLAATPSRTFNLFVQLYFQHFDRICPILHRPTFEPSRCPVLLLGAICAVGAMYSSIPHATEFAQMFMTVVNRAIFACLPNDSGLMRNVGYMQALLLNFNFFRSSGNQRMLELAESARSPLTTATRRSRLFDRLHSRSSTSNSTDRGDATSSSWLDWIEEETGRRTAWYYFISDMELSAAWKLPPSFALDELKTELPQDDVSWQAPSATAWAARSEHRAPPVYLAQLHDALRSGAVHDVSRRLDGLGASSTQRAILSYSLCSLGLTLWSLELSCLSSVVAHGTEEFAHISSAFLETMAASSPASSGASQGASGKVSTLPWHESPSHAARTHTTATAEVLLRFVLLRNCIDIADIQLLAGRSGRRDDMQRSFRHLRSHFLQQSHKLWPALVHSGRILHLCTHAQIDSMYEFYAATALFVCAKVWPDVYGHPDASASDRAAPHGHSAVHLHLQGRQPQAQAQAFPPHATLAICLDGEQPVSLDEPRALVSARYARIHKAQLPPRSTAPSSSFFPKSASQSQAPTHTHTHTPGPPPPGPTPTPTLNSLFSMDITSPGAPAQILRCFSERLLSRPATRAWPIGQLLGRIMGEMAGVVGV